MLRDPHTGELTAAGKVAKAEKRIQMMGTAMRNEIMSNGFNDHMARRKKAGEASDMENTAEELKAALSSRGAQGRRLTHVFEQFGHKGLAMRRRNERSKANSKKPRRREKAKVKAAPKSSSQMDREMKQQMKRFRTTCAECKVISMFVHVFDERGARAPRRFAPES